MRPCPSHLAEETERSAGENLPELNSKARGIPHGSRNVRGDPAGTCVTELSVANESRRMMMPIR